MNSNKKSSIVKNEMFTLAGTLVVLCLIMTVLSDKFLTKGNLLNVLRQASQYGIIAIGMTMVILLGGIDLSVGSIQALAGVAAVWTLNTFNSIALAIIAGIVVGAIVGLGNGMIITKLKIQPLICTLGTMSIVSGITFIITNAVSIQAKNSNYMTIGMGRFYGIPIPVIVLTVLAVAFYYILNHTIYGRYIYSIGGNKEAAKLVGIPVDRITVVSYVIDGALAGLAAVILSSRLGSGQASAGTGFEMTVISAVIIGGVSLNGGRGNLVGAILGVLTLYVLTNGLVLLDISSFWQQVIRGSLIILAVFIDRIRSDRVSKQLLQASFAESEQG